MSLEDHDTALVRAGNPGPFTLTGTNTWLVGRDPCWIVDPGPALDEHVDAVLHEAAARGGVGGIVLTHDHGDHSEAAPAVSEQTGAEVFAAARPPTANVLQGPLEGPLTHVRRSLVGGERVGPFDVVATPGHAPDHLAYVAGAVGFSGDAVLGEGSVFVIGRLAEYLAALEELRARRLELLCPGHGPLIEDPDGRLAAYVEHRLDRERRLVEALDAGLRGADELLARVWDDAPEVLRLAAMVTLGAHLDKLADERRLPGGVERPQLPADLSAP